MELSSVPRLAALELSGILHYGQYERLTTLCRTAVQLLEVDASQLNVITATQQIYAAEWPKARRAPTPLTNSGCREVVVAEHTLVIPNTAEHPIMCTMPWVSDWRGYLGAPVWYKDQVLGSMCVLSRRVRAWTLDDQRIMEGLAKQASERLG